MGELVFTIGANGSIEGLLKDEILDTSKMGKRKIERVTEILFNEEEQRFYIKWLMGPFEGYNHTVYRANRALGKETIPVTPEVRPEDIVFFDTYAQAVDHEIKCVNALRTNGFFFA